MTSPNRSDLGGIENDTLDFSQLEDYINDEEPSNLYFSEDLVSSDTVKDHQLYGIHVNRNQGVTKIDATGPSLTHHLTTGQSLAQGSGTNGHSVTPLVKSDSFRHGSVPTTTFCKPHLPDSPPDSGSEPPFSPPDEDPKMNCSTTNSLDMIHHHHPHHQHPHHQQISPPHLLQNIVDGKSYVQHALHLQALKHVHDVNQNSSSQQQLHSLHQNNPSLTTNASSSLPLLSTASETPLLNHLSQTILSPVHNSQQQLLIPPLDQMYPEVDNILYGNISSPLPSTHYKKRKLSHSPSRNCITEVIQVKAEPLVSSSPDHSGVTMLPSSDDDYNLDLGRTDGGSPFADSNYQCIRFQPFHQHTWVQLLDSEMTEIISPHFRVDADKGFNFSNADESFVCQKKNHFQVTVHLQHLSAAKPRFIRTLSDGIRPIEKFALQFHGVKMESPTQTIKVEQSQSDRSKKPFKPVHVELVSEQVTKTTVGRLHFSETTSNNMRKKGKPNPDQRFFFLVVSLCAHVAGEPETYYPVIAHSSEKIIVRASNPGQFENDVELSWQKGSTPESIFHAGRVGINTDRPEESLVVHGNIKVTGHIVQPSDIRAKVDIHELDTKEQLKNVSNLRIVRYRYQPEFAVHVKASQAIDTGVIAQEVREIIPEAVMEAGDVHLPNGQLVDGLLVVNKERIFMENVGAVKELCKVTDNLENRIDELERMNKKLTKIKRIESIKSNGTDLSRVSSLRGGYRSSKPKPKSCLSKSMDSCSSCFVQSAIIALVSIMAFCLIATITLYIMDWQRTHQAPTHLAAIKAVTTKSSTSYSQLSPNISDGQVTAAQSSFRNSSQEISFTNRTGSKSQVKAKSSAKPTDYGRNSFLDLYECDCSTFCCDLFESDHHYEVTPLSELPQNPGVHIDSKRSDSDFEKLKVSYNFGNSSSDEDDLTNSKLKKQESSSDRNKIQQESRKYRKREVQDSTTELEISEIEQSLIQLVELNVTFKMVRCKRHVADSLLKINCFVAFRRHDLPSNITVRFSNDGTIVSDFCGGFDFESCHEDKTHGRRLHQETQPLANEANSWIIPAGSYLSSRFIFRFKSRSFNPEEEDDEELCAMHDTQHLLAELVIQFQRVCPT